MGSFSNVLSAWGRNRVYLRNISIFGQRLDLKTLEVRLSMCSAYTGQHDSDQSSVEIVYGRFGLFSQIINTVYSECTVHEHKHHGIVHCN